MNFFMIKAYGIVGCSLSTITGYVVSVLMVVIVTSRMELLKLSKKIRFIIRFNGLYYSEFVFKHYWPLVILILFAMGLIVIDYGNDVLKLLNGFKKKE